MKKNRIKKNKSLFLSDDEYYKIYIEAFLTRRKIRSLRNNDDFIDILNEFFDSLDDGYRRALRYCIQQRSIFKKIDYYKEKGNFIHLLYKHFLKFREFYKIKKGEKVL